MCMNVCIVYCFRFQLLLPLHWYEYTNRIRETNSRSRARVHCHLIEWILAFPLYCSGMLVAKDQPTKPLSWMLTGGMQEIIFHEAYEYYLYSLQNAYIKISISDVVVDNTNTRTHTHTSLYQHLFYFSLYEYRGKVPIVFWA